MNYKLNGIISKIRSKQTNQNENINKTYTTCCWNTYFFNDQEKIC